MVIEDEEQEKTKKTKKIQIGGCKYGVKPTLTSAVLRRIDEPHCKKKKLNLQKFFILNSAHIYVIKFLILIMAEESTPDSNIDYDAAVKYWSSVPATVDGVLGGFGESTPVPKADVAGSAGFIRRLKPSMAVNPGQIAYGLDIGAG